MAVDSENGILGVRFYAEGNRKILEETWNSDSVSRRDLSRMWFDKCQAISSTQRIIGYSAVTTGDYITKFGWAVWEP